MSLRFRNVDQDDISLSCVVFVVLYVVYITLKYNKTHVFKGPPTYILYTNPLDTNRYLVPGLEVRKHEARRVGFPTPDVSLC